MARRRTELKIAEVVKSEDTSIELHLNFYEGHPMVTFRDVMFGKPGTAIYLRPELFPKLFDALNVAEEVLSERGLIDPVEDEPYGPDEDEAYGPEDETILRATEAVEEVPSE